MLGGFAYDRALGKPVTLDIGFGPFKTRVVGPPDDTGSGTRSIEGSADGSSSKFDDAVSSNIALVASSGTLKAIGEASRVSTILKLQCEFLLMGDKKICWQYSKVSIELKYMHSFMLFLFSYLICDLTFESTTLN